MKLLRNELKFFISTKDAYKLMDRLSIYLHVDEHSSAGPYNIKSVYLDTINNSDLVEKLNGNLYREKYRFRYYDDDLSCVKFEIKRKLNTLIEKNSFKCNENDLINVLNGNLNFSFLNKENEYVKSRLKYLNYRPVVLVEYSRLAFYLPFNNIRVTFDSNLKACDINKSINQNSSFVLNGFTHTIHSSFSNYIVEVKYLDYLPDMILNELSNFNLIRSSISKYVHSRKFNYFSPFEDGLYIPF